MGEIDERGIDVWNKKVEEAKLNWTHDQPIVVKITDFGLAANIETEKQKFKEDPKTFAEMESFKGTVPFMCPEKNYSKQRGEIEMNKYDIYSFGACLYYMLFKKLPTADIDEEKSD